MTLVSGFMDEALAQAQSAADRGEVPIGAVVVKQGEIIASASNRTLEMHDVTAHAEVLAIREAGVILGSDRLTGCDLYVTLEPCTMCAAAISFARIRRLYFAAPDEKGGGVISGVRFFDTPTCHHAPDVYSGMAEADAAAMLKRFFQSRR